MKTNSRFIKSVNYSPPTPEDMQCNASALINSRIRGFMNGLERREIARASADPALRDAARILDERDAVAWPQSVISAQAARQVGDATTPSVDPAKADTVASPAARRPLMQPSIRPRGVDGKFVSRQFVRSWEPVRRLLRDLRESRKDGVA